MTANQEKMQVALRMMKEGTMRVDVDAGLVYRTFATPLYSYERPVGTVTSNGYVRVFLNEKDSLYAHRLVWAAAHGGQIDEKMVINHKNSVRTDNRIANLELLTYRANGAHAAATGRMPKGENHPSATVTDEQAREIRRAALADEGTYRQIAERFGVSPSLVSHIMLGLGRFKDL